MEQFLEILSKPDNIPIVGLLVSVIFFTWFALKKGRRNDAQGFPVEATMDDKVQVWPYLVRVEFLATTFISISEFEAKFDGRPHANAHCCADVDRPRGSGQCPDA